MKERKIGNYILENKIDSYSKVYKCRDNKNEYAIKIIDIENLNKKIKENLNYEIDILKKLNHKNLINESNTLLEYKINCINEIIYIADKLNNLESVILYEKYLKILNELILIIEDKKLKDDCKKKFIFYLDKCYLYLKNNIINFNIKLRTAEEIIYKEAIELLKTAMISKIINIESNNLIISSLKLFDSLKLDNNKKLTEYDIKYIQNIYDKAYKLLNKNN